MEKIGEGALGKIYKNNDRIIKIIPNKEYLDIINKCKLKEDAINAVYPIPKTYSVEVKDDGIYIEKDFVEGITLTEAFKKNPEKAGELLVRMVNLQKKIHSTLFDFPYHFSDKLKGDIKNVHDSEKDTVLAFLDTLKEDRLCHGDFHPDNIIVNGNSMVAIDWDNATPGDPYLDVARTFLLLKSHAPEITEYYLNIYFNELEMDKEKFNNSLKAIALQFKSEKANSKNIELINSILNGKLKY